MRPSAYALTRFVCAEMDGRIVATGKVEPEEAWAQTEVADQACGSQVEIGWVVSPDHQGQGIGTEFARALRDIAFASGARRVTAYCFADNIASARIMEKIGMHREAHFRADSLHRSGEWLDSLVHAALDTDPPLETWSPAGSHVHWDREAIDPLAPEQHRNDCVETSGR